MAIYVYNEASWQCPLHPATLTALLQAMYAFVCEEDAALELHVVRDGAMAALNTQHMHSFGPTNILSFPAKQSHASSHTPSHVHTSSTQPPHILVLSVDTWRRECLLYGQEPYEHLVRLLAHGLGHVLGYDHGEEMFALCELMEEQGRLFLRKGEL